MKYFYPRPPRGGRHPVRSQHFAAVVFLSTPSARRATSRHTVARTRSTYFYPRPPRGGRHLRFRLLQSCANFYPRPPRGGRRLGDVSPVFNRKFLSTPSARRATRPLHCAGRARRISIHALREEGDLASADRVVVHAGISIHALREEGDRLVSLWLRIQSYFYPRPPRGGRLSHQFLCDFWFNISIHALREEGDLLCCKDRFHFLYFYPRPPRGGRPDYRYKPSYVTGISIHALREEGDVLRRPSRRFPCYFYPRPPRGGRRHGPQAQNVTLIISIHALREEGDSRGPTNTLSMLRFLSTPSARRATVKPV